MKKIFDYLPPIVIGPAVLVGFPIFLVICLFIPLKWNPLNKAAAYLDESNVGGIL